MSNRFIYLPTIIAVLSLLYHPVHPNPPTHFINPEIKVHRLKPEATSDIRHQFGTLGHFRSNSWFLDYKCYFHKTLLMNGTAVEAESSDEKEMRINSFNVGQAVTKIAVEVVHSNPVVDITASYGTSGGYESVSCESRKVVPNSVNETEFRIVPGSSSFPAFLPPRIRPCNNKVCSSSSKLVCYQWIGFDQELTNGGDEKTSSFYSISKYHLPLMYDQVYPSDSNLITRSPDPDPYDEFAGIEGGSLCYKPNFDKSGIKLNCVTGIPGPNAVPPNSLTYRTFQYLDYDPESEGQLPRYQLIAKAASVDYNKCPQSAEEEKNGKYAFPMTINDEERLIHIGETILLSGGKGILKPRQNMNQQCDVDKVKCYYQTWAEGTRPEFAQMYPLAVKPQTAEDNLNITDPGCSLGWTIEVADMAEYKFEGEPTHTTIIGCYQDVVDGTTEIVAAFEFFVQKAPEIVVEGKDCIFGGLKQKAEAKNGKCKCEMKVSTCNPIRREHTFIKEDIDCPDDTNMAVIIAAAVLGVIGLLVIVVVILVLKKPKAPPPSMSVVIGPDGMPIDPALQGDQVGMDSGVNSLAPGTESAAGEPSAAGTGSEAAPDFMTATSEQPPA